MDDIQTSQLYDGTVTIEFNQNAKRNRYKITDNGVLLKPSPPSVTSITELRDKSAGLVPWGVGCAITICKQRIQSDAVHSAGFLEDVWADATNNYRRIKKEKADVGTLAHDALERYFTTPPDEFTPPLPDTPVRKRFDEALSWFQKHKVETLHTERSIYSRKHGYCGRLDNISRIDKVLSILDYKSSKGVYSTMVFQAAAYAKAYEEETGEKIKQAYILQIGEDKTTPYLFNQEKLDIAFDAFLGLLQMYKSEKALGKIEPEEDWIS